MRYNELLEAINSREEKAKTKQQFALLDNARAHLIQSDMEITKGFNTIRYFDVLLEEECKC